MNLPNLYFAKLFPQHVFDVNNNVKWAVWGSPSEVLFQQNQVEFLVFLIIISITPLM